MQHSLKQRVVGAVWFGVVAFIATILALIDSGTKSTAIFFNINVLIITPLGALLGFLFGYRILLLSGGGHLRAVLIGFAVCLLALVLFVLGIDIYIGIKTLWHCNNSTTITCSVLLQNYFMLALVFSYMSVLIGGWVLLLAGMVAGLGLYLLRQKLN